MSIETTESVRRREVALSLAVQHHGLANHAQQAAPARSDTVVQTAEEFERYISNGTIPNRPTGRR